MTLTSSAGSSAGIDGRPARGHRPMMIMQRTTSRTRGWCSRWVVGFQNRYLHAPHPRVNRAWHRIASINQHPISMGTKSAPTARVVLEMQVTLSKTEGRSCLTGGKARCSRASAAAARAAAPVTRTPQNYRRGCLFGRGGGGGGTTQSITSQRACPAPPGRRDMVSQLGSRRNRRGCESRARGGKEAPYRQSQRARRRRAAWCRTKRRMNRAVLGPRGGRR